MYFSIQNDIVSFISLNLTRAIFARDLILNPATPPIKHTKLASFIVLLESHLSNFVCNPIASS